MKKNSMRERLLASSMIGGAAMLGLAATPAFAQTAPAAAPEAVQMQEIVVTGSRIPQPNMTSVSPVQVVNAHDIAIGGRPNTIDFLSQLPQVTFNSGADLGPSSDPLSTPGGVSTVDLRGLGPQRTLVLVDGRRLGIGDPNTGNPNPAPDINQIPSQLIDRVEVLTGGASATYGSDAVAGVVNFVMKHNFEGVQLDAQWGVNQHGQGNDYMQNLERQSGVTVPGGAWDGRSADYSLIFGANAPDGKGNIEGFVTYHVQNPVFQAARDYSACQLLRTGKCGGSANSNLFDPALSTQTFGDLAVQGSDFIPWGSATTTPPTLFNSNPYMSLISQDTRYTGGFFGNYELNKNFNVYSNFSYMHDESHVQIAPSGLFEGSGAQSSGGFLVACSLLSAQQLGAVGGCPDTGSVEMLIGRRNIEGGPRISDYVHDNYRVVLGTKGDLWGPFKYDLYGSYYYASVFTGSDNYLSISRTQNALLGCPTGSGSGCVPFNIFSDGGVTDEALAYLMEDGTARGTTTERVIEGTITGDLSQWGLKSPWATDGVGVSAGFQVRHDSLTFNPDATEINNDLSGAGGASVTIDQTIGVTEGFGEVRVPIVQDMPFAHDLSFNGGYRYSTYTTGAEADTYKLGMEWAPTPDFRLRGGFNRAIRAPSILELYTPLSVTNTSDVSEDPCAGANPTATLTQCERTGVTAAEYGHIGQCPAQQCATLVGGNVDLAPERANTYTVGAVLTPRAIPGLFASIDYYHIDVKGMISNVPLQVSMDNCLNTGDPIYCANVVRNPTNGILFGTTVGAGGYISGTNVNIGEALFTGYDVQAAYKLGFDTFGHDGWGSLVFSLAGSYQPEQKQTPLPGADTYDCAGLFGPTCEGIYPKWRHTFRTTWNAPHDVQVTATWRFIGGAEYEGDSDEPTIGNGTTDPIAHTVPSVNYLDLAANWNVNEKLAVRAGINNIFDRDPPLIENNIVGGGLPNTYPTYDLLGRHLFVALTARF